MSGRRKEFANRPAVVAATIAVVAGLATIRSTDFQAPPRFDGAGYSVLARALAEGKGYREIDHPDSPRHGHFPPGYPAALAALWTVTGGAERAAHVASVVWTMAAAVVAWAWFRQFMKPRAANLLGLAVAVNWTWHRNGGSIQSEPLYLLLGGLILLTATVVGRRGGVVRGVGLGILLAAGLLTRHVAAATALAVGLDLMLRRKPATALAAGASCAALVAPWVAWLASVGENTQAELLAKSGLANRIAIQGAFYAQRLPDTLTGPFVEVATVFRESGPMALAANAWALLASAVIVAGWVAMLRRGRSRLAGLVPLTTLGLLLVWPFTEAGRFLIPLVPCIAAGAAEGLARLLRRIGVRRARTPAAALVLAASLPYAAHALVGDRSAALRGTYADFDAACEWLAAVTEPAGPVLTRHPGEVYWRTGRKALAPPSADPEDIMRAIERYRVAFLLVDEERYAHAPSNPISALVRDRPESFREVWRRGVGRGSTAIVEVLPTQRRAPSNLSRP